MPTLPKGIITLWYGSIASIPAGFVLCDGTNDTPDLRDRFIVGAGSTYSVNDTGGGVQHSHTFTGDGHTHDHPAGVMLAAGENFSKITETAPATGTTDNTNHLPPYHALVFIMKT